MARVPQVFWVFYQGYYKQVAGRLPVANPTTANQRLTRENRTTHW